MLNSSLFGDAERLEKDYFSTLRQKRDSTTESQKAELEKVRSIAKADGAICSIYDLIGAF